jgi:putative ABC transport system permease protein
MVLGVFITFRVLDFPDLTVDGSLPLGAAVAAALIVHGSSPWLATIVGVGAGICAGTVTGVLHILLKSGQSDTNNYGPKLLAGILTMTALYTINLRVMGRSNTPLLGVETFLKKSSIINYSETALKADSDHIQLLANLEGLTAHANSVAVRVK